MPVISDLAADPGLRSLSCRILVPLDLPVFRGHFPTTPIVPGVIQVGWAVELARAHGLSRGRFTGISSAKFRRLVQPGMRLAARLEPGTRQGLLQFRFESGNAIVSTGRLQFGDGRD